MPSGPGVRVDTGDRGRRPHPAGLRQPHRQAHGPRAGPRRGDRPARPGARRDRDRRHPDDPAVPPRRRAQRVVRGRRRCRPAGSTITGTATRPERRGRAGAPRGGPGGDRRRAALAALPAAVEADGSATARVGAAATAARDRRPVARDGPRRPRWTDGRRVTATASRRDIASDRAASAAVATGDRRSIRRAGDAVAGLARADAPGRGTPCSRGPTTATARSLLGPSRRIRAAGDRSTVARSSSTGGASRSRSRPRAAGRPPGAGDRAAARRRREPGRSTSGRSSRAGRERRGGAGRRRRRRPAAPRRRGDEDAERASGAAGRAPSRGSASAAGVNDRGRRPPRGHQ